MPLMRSFSAMSIDSKYFTASPEKRGGGICFPGNLFSMRCILRYKNR